MVSTNVPNPVSWRPKPFLRFIAVAYLGLSIGLGACVIAIAANEAAVPQGVGFVTVFFWLPGVVGLRYAFRTRIETRADELVVVTTFSEHRFPWAEIADASAGYGGISLLLRNGSTFLAGAVQKNNIDTWRNRRTEADDLVDLIVARAKEIDKSR